MTLVTQMPETLDSDVVDSELEDMAEVESTGDVVDDSLGDDLDPETEDDAEPSTDEPTNTGDPIQPPVNAINAEEHFRQRVEQAEQYALSTMLAEMKAEDAHKAAKAEAKAARETLQAIMDRGPEQLPLFDQDKADQPAVAEATTDEQPAGTVEAKAEPDDESWKEVEVGELDLPTGIVEKLIAAELETVGKLAAWSASEKLLTDIPGIGGAKAAKIEEATEKFWAERKAAV